MQWRDGRDGNIVANYGLSKRNEIGSQVSGNLQEFKCVIGILKTRRKVGVHG